jgi:hypothetical protein
VLNLAAGRFVPISGSQAIVHRINKMIKSVLARSTSSCLSCVYVCEPSNQRSLLHCAAMAKRLRAPQSKMMHCDASVGSIG